MFLIVLFRKKKKMEEKERKSNRKLFQTKHTHKTLATISLPNSYSYIKRGDQTRVVSFYLRLK
jgi:hypothetical protein